MNDDALASLRGVADSLENHSPSTEPSRPSEESQGLKPENRDFLGFHCPIRMKRQLQTHADIEGVTLSQFVREVLTMELIRLSRQEVSSREQLMRERRIQARPTLDDEGA